MNQRKEDKLLLGLGKRITYLRNLKGMSQLDLGIEAEVSKNYICDVESGRRNPSLTSLNKIAKGLGITLSDLLKGI